MTFWLTIATVWLVGISLITALWRIGSAMDREYEARRVERKGQAEYEMDQRRKWHHINNIVQGLEGRVHIIEETLHLPNPLRRDTPPEGTKTS